MKRKIIITLISIITIFALFGCGSNSAVNTIGPWDTSDEQANAAIEILTIGGFSAFAKFNVDETYQSAKMGIEYYKDGKLVKDEGQGSYPIDEASEGLAGFSCKAGIATLGFSLAESTGSASDIQLKNYPTEAEEDILFTTISESKDIADGQKIYLGILSADNDQLDASALDASFDKKELAGKNWLFYVEFSTKPLD